MSKIGPPRSRYEYLERIGQVLGLPAGYSYSSQPLVDLDTALREAAPKAVPNASLRDRHFNVGIGKSRSTQALAKRSRKHDIPAGTVRPPPPNAAVVTDQSKAPFGFSTTCPFPGYDPDVNEGPTNAQSKMSRTRSGRLEQKGFSSITSGSSYTAPNGYTFDKRVILFQNNNQSLKLVPSIIDFPENAPVLFDIIQPNSQKLQRVLTRVVCINKELSAVNVQPDNADE